MHSLKPFKAAGMDGNCPALLENAGQILLNRLVTLYKACLRIRHIPEVCKYHLYTETRKS